MMQHWRTFMQPLLQWKSNNYYIFRAWVCSLIYPAFNAHAPCCHLWYARLLQCFSTLSKKARFSEKTTCVFCFCLHFVAEVFLILRRIRRDVILYVCVCVCVCIYIVFGGLEVACWPLVPKFAGSNPAEALGFFRAKESSARLPSEGK